MSLTLLGRLDQLHKLSRECKELRITGFQSPAEDEKEKSLSFDLIVGLGKPQVWVFKVDDDSLLRFGLFPGDRIAVDRSIDCKPDCLAVVHMDGDSQYRLRLLTKDDNGELSKIILPIHGYGLWSTLYGFLALEPDVNTIAGLGFYEHAETPGLGGEVDNPKWKGIWPGKKLFDEDGELAISVIKGTVDSGAAGAQHKVDGLAGATLTTNGLHNLVRFWMGENGFGPYLSAMKAQVNADELPAVESDSEFVDDEEVSNG